MTEQVVLEALLKGGSSTLMTVAIALYFGYKWYSAIQASIAANRDELTALNRAYIDHKGCCDTRFCALERKTLGMDGSLAKTLEDIRSGVEHVRGAQEFADKLMARLADERKSQQSIYQAPPPGRL